MIVSKQGMANSSSLLRRRRRQQWRAQRQQGLTRQSTHKGGPAAHKRSLDSNTILSPRQLQKDFEKAKTVITEHNKGKSDLRLLAPSYRMLMKVDGAACMMLFQGRQFEGNQHVEQLQSRFPPAWHASTGWPEEESQRVDLSPWSEAVTKNT